ncbi:MAG: hypothetical protein HC936_01365 [Leptolyngbyaceae cyanobacterium SU_3_3]|nr:hypothetical protein [Leptolyngbyaceae cyanobacterium SU_3_3]
MTNTGGSGADIYFCDGNSASEPGGIPGHDRCLKYVVHVNQRAQNPFGDRTPTDVYIYVHNGNWYTDFRLD